MLMYGQRIQESGLIQMVMGMPIKGCILNQIIVHLFMVRVAIDYKDVQTSMEILPQTSMTMMLTVMGFVMRWSEPLLQELFCMTPTMQIQHL